MPTLHRLLYRSHCALEGVPDQVDAQVAALVQASEATNARHGLTGALLYSSGIFIQALEGPLDAVEATFERICADMRHRDLRLIDFTTAETRAFPEWAMASLGPQGALVTLCSTVDAIEKRQMDPSDAESAIQLMRSMLAGTATAAIA